MLTSVMARSANRLPLVVVLGATACGKSKLAIELAQRFNGEIISADSMQVYRNLDIVTNKVNVDEKRIVKHHLIDFVDPLERYSIVDFRDTALLIIDDLMKRERLPIVVGGTHYYLESIIWKNFLVGQSDSQINERKCEEKSIDENDGSEKSVSQKYLILNEFEQMQKLHPSLKHTEQDFDDPELLFKKPIYNDAFAHVESERLWRILEKVDPECAYTYHPNDKRRIIRCLQIIQQKQTNFSDLITELNDLNGTFSRGGPLRYHPTCVFWVHVNKTELEILVNSRVDQMIERGLIEELEQFHEHYNRTRIISQDDADYTKGIFQSIGFKEFHEYLMLPDNDAKRGEEGRKLLVKSIKQLKQSTLKYANKQLRWIKRRMLNQSSRDLPPIFKLDATNIEEWDSNVNRPAIQIVESIFDSRPIPDEFIDLMQEPEREWYNMNNPGKFFCDICDKLFIGSHYWNEHVKSRAHRKRKSASTKKDSEYVHEKGEKSLQEQATDI